MKKIHTSKKHYVLPIKSGMSLEVHEKVGDWDNTRLWKFKGLVIKVNRPQSPDGTFTMRGTVARMTIEKIYPLSFQHFDKVLLMDEYRTRRAKLYYMRDKVGKGAKMKSIISSDRKELDLLKVSQEEIEKAFVEIQAAEEAIKTEEKKVETVEIQEEKVETPEEKKEVKIEETEEKKD